MGACGHLRAILLFRSPTHLQSGAHPVFGEVQRTGSINNETSSYPHYSGRSDLTIACYRGVSEISDWIGVIPDRYRHDVDRLYDIPDMCAGRHEELLEINYRSGL